MSLVIKIRKLGGLAKAYSSGPHKFEKKKIYKVKTRFVCFSNSKYNFKLYMEFLWPTGDFQTK